MTRARSARLAVALALKVLLFAGWPVAAGAEAPSTSRADAPAAQGGEDGAEAPATGSLLVVVSGFRNLKGQLLLAVFASEEGFPNDMKRAIFHRAFPIEKTGVIVRVPALAPGTYAVAVHHDEDSDFEMNKGFLGIPREGYGASRDAPARFGPPKFKHASFQLEKGQQRKLLIHVRYF